MCLGDLLASHGRRACQTRVQIAIEPRVQLCLTAIALDDLRERFEPDQRLCQERLAESATPRFDDEVGEPVLERPRRFGGRLIARGRLTAARKGMHTNSRETRNERLSTRLDGNYGTSGGSRRHA